MLDFFAVGRVRLELTASSVSDLRYLPTELPAYMI